MQNCLPHYITSTYDNLSSQHLTNMTSNLHTHDVASLQPRPQAGHTQKYKVGTRLISALGSQIKSIHVCMYESLEKVTPCHTTHHHHHHWPRHQMYTKQQEMSGVHCAHSHHSCNHGDRLSSISCWLVGLTTDCLMSCSWLYCTQGQGTGEACMNMASH